MVMSQIECLEMPQADETDVLTINASGTVEEVQGAVKVAVQTGLLMERS